MADAAAQQRSNSRSRTAAVHKPVADTQAAAAVPTEAGKKRKRLRQRNSQAKRKKLVSFSQLLKQHECRTAALASPCPLHVKNLSPGPPRLPCHAHSFNSPSMCRLGSRSHQSWRAAAPTHLQCRQHHLPALMPRRSSTHALRGPEQQPCMRLSEAGSQSQPRQLSHAGARRSRGERRASSASRSNR